VNRRQSAQQARSWARSTLLRYIDEKKVEICHREASSFTTKQFSVRYPSTKRSIIRSDIERLTTGRKNLLQGMANCPKASPQASPRSAVSKASVRFVGAVREPPLLPYRSNRTAGLPITAPAPVRTLGTQPLSPNTQRPASNPEPGVQPPTPDAVSATLTVRGNRLRSLRRQRIFCDISSLCVLAYLQTRKIYREDAPCDETVFWFGRW
jgi:hypothetical protein